MHQTRSKSHSRLSTFFRKYDIVPPILLLVLAIIFFWPQIFGRRVLYFGDIGLYFWPMQRFLHANLVAGRLPLWNPYILCGAPFVGNPQTWPLYPSTVLTRLLPAEYAINATVALHVWLAGYGAYSFLRHAASLRRAPSLLGAFVFMFGGMLVSKEQFPNMLQAAAYLPWALLAVDRLVCAPGMYRAVCLGVALGLQLLAAHAQMTLLTLYLTAVYGVFAVVQQCRRVKRRSDWESTAMPGSTQPLPLPSLAHIRTGAEYAARLLGAVIAGALVAVGLAAGEMLPIVELYRAAWRQRLSFTIVNRFYLPWTQFTNFILPAQHGQPYTGNFTARGNFWETCCYVGWTCAVCVLFAIAYVIGASFARRSVSPAPDGVVEDSFLPRIVWLPAGRAPIWFWTAAALVGTWMAMGGGGHLYRLAYKYAPGFRSFHDPARCLLWASFALAALGAYGFQLLLARMAANPTGRESGGYARRRKLFAFAVLVFTFCDLCHFGRTIYPLTASANLYAVMPGGAVGSVCADRMIRKHQARILAPDTTRVWLSFSSHRSYRQGVPGYMGKWRETMTPNLPMTSGLLDAFGYDPETRLDAQTILGAIVYGFRYGATDHEQSLAASLAGVYGVRYVATDRLDRPDDTLARIHTIRAEPTLSPPTEPNWPGRLYLSTDTAWQPRARLTYNAEIEPTPQAAVKAVSAYAAGNTQIDMIRTTVLVRPASAAQLADVRAATAPWLPEQRRRVARRHGAVSIGDHDPDRVVVETNSPRPALLVLADTLHPGWRATLDGRPTPILSADGFIRAVALPTAGRHRVIFTYYPASFAVGLYVSLITLCVVISVLVGARGSARNHFS